jgi:hypothetical protein
MGTVGATSGRPVDMPGAFVTVVIAPLAPLVRVGDGTPLGTGRAPRTTPAGDTDRWTGVPTAARRDPVTAGRNTVVAGGASPSVGTT